MGSLFGPGTAKGWHESGKYPWKQDTSGDFDEVLGYFEVRGNHSSERKTEPPRLFLVLTKDGPSLRAFSVMKQKKGETFVKNHRIWMNDDREFYNAQINDCTAKGLNPLTDEPWTEEARKEMPWLIKSSRAVSEPLQSSERWASPAVRSGSATAPSSSRINEEIPEREFSGRNSETPERDSQSPERDTPDRGTPDTEISNAESQAKRAGSAPA